MTLSVVVGSERYQSTWKDWWHYSADGLACKTKIMNLLYDTGEMLLLVDSGKYNNDGIFAEIDRVSDLTEKCHDEVNVFEDVKTDPEIIKLLGELNSNVKRLLKVRRHQSFLFTILETLGSVIGYSFSSGVKEGVDEFYERYRAVNPSRSDGDDSEIVLCKKSISESEINAQRRKITQLNDELRRAESDYRDAIKEFEEARINAYDNIELSLPPSIKMKYLRILYQAQSYAHRCATKVNRINLQIAQEQIKLSRMSRQHV